MRAVPHVVGTMLALWLLALSWGAHAGEQADAIKQAQAAEARFEPALAARHYKEAVAVDPGSRLARRARARLTWLELRNVEGYAPLTILMRMRATVADEQTAASLAAFDEQLRSFPAGIVRREALAVLANAHQQRGEHAAALDAFDRWSSEPGVSSAEYQLAMSGAALSRAKLGGANESERALMEAGLASRAEAVLLRSQRVGRRGTWLAALSLVSFLGLGFGLGGHRGAVPSGLRRALHPKRVALGIYLLGPPLLMARLYDRQLVPQVALVIAACAGVLLSASIVGVGLDASDVSPSRRRAVAALAAAATLGAAFIALDRSRLLFDILLAWEQAP